MRLNQKTRVGLFIIGLALVILVAWKIGQNRAANSTPEATPMPTTTTVVMRPGNQVAVARIDIPERTVITKDMLVMKDGSRYTETDRTDRYATDPVLLDGMVSNKLILRDKPIDRRADVFGNINDLGVGALVRPGLRAMFVPIANKATLHNLVKVGDYVDIVAGFEGLESKTIVQNKRVLAVDVFVDDFPTRSIARKGDYKAAPRGDAAPPPPPPGPEGQPAPGAPAPTPTPAPGNGQPVPAPEAALTLEVTPDDVVAINLSVNSNALLDYVIRPRDAGTAVPEVRVAAITKARLAPSAYRGKVAPGAAAAAKPVSTGGGGGRQPNWSAPAPPKEWGTPTTPINPESLGAVKPPTYDIPIYGDGKIVRIDTVRKPEGSY